MNYLPSKFSIPEQLCLFNPLDTKTDIRVGNTFARGLFLIDEQFPEDSRLIKSLILFFHNEVQNNIFGCSSFDVNSFAELMGFEVSNLNAKHPNPFQLKIMSEEQRSQLIKEEERSKKKWESDRLPYQAQIWDTVLENALYILCTQSIKLEYGSSVSYDDVSVINTGITGQRYLNSVEKTIQVSEKNQLKKVYSYELNKDFLISTLRMYSNIDIKKISIFRKRKLDNFYIFLSSIVNYKLYEAKSQGITKDYGFFECRYQFYYALVKRIMGLNCKSEAENKRKIQDKLTTLKTMVEPDEFSFEPEWINIDKTSRYKYDLLIKFTIPRSRIKSDEEAKQAIERTSKEVSFFNLYHTGFRDRVPELYFTGTMYDKVIGFRSWLQDDAKDFNIKLAIIEDSHEMVFGKREHSKYFNASIVYGGVLRDIKKIDIEKNAFMAWQDRITPIQKLEEPKQPEEFKLVDNIEAR